MRDQEKNQLLGDLFGDEELNQLRQASLSCGLQAMRGRRRRALAVRAFVLALPVLMLAAMVFYPRFEAPHPSTAAHKIAFASKPESKVEYITTEQLFALFPNRQMALVGKPGHQQLIFLDDHPLSKNQ